jgi:hypothetical protein
MKASVQLENMLVVSLKGLVDKKNSWAVTPVVK